MSGTGRLYFLRSAGIEAMAEYFIKRVLIMVPTLVGIMVISFMVIHLAPGDPASQKFGGAGQATAGMDASRSTEAAEKKFRERFHLDRSIPVQFGFFLQRLFRGDLTYYQQHKPIGSDLWAHLWVTLQLQVVVFFLIYLIAIPLGIYSAAFPRTWGDRITTLGLFLLYSVPTFWAADVLRMWLGDYFPIFGLQSDGAENWPWWKRFFDYLHHIVLPVICLTYGGLAYLSRQMRVGMLEVIRQDYIRTAYAKGASKSRVILRHALRNALFPVITLFASLLPMLIGGSIIVEFSFNIQGMGWYTWDAVGRREYDVVMATLMLSACLTLAGILISDLLYAFVNPQVTFENRR